MLNKFSQFLLMLLLCVVSAPSSAQGPTLDQILNRTGATVNQFLTRLGDVKCNEQVIQEKFNLKGKTEERVESAYEYIVIAQNQGNEPMIYEAREAHKTGHIKKHVSLLISNGFATQLLVFHPYYQPSFTFDRLQDIHSGNRTFAQIHFQHVKGRPTPVALLLRGREYPLSLAGTAVIDPENGIVQHITTELGSSMEDLGLKSFRSDVEYASMAFPRESKTYWLPSQATVEVNTPKQHWKNIHRFSDYNLFSVSVSSEVNLEKLKSKEQ